MSAQDTNANNTNKKVIFKNFAPFRDCLSETNNAQVDNAKDIDILLPLYNLVEYNDNYLNTTRSLLQFYRYEPFLIVQIITVNRLDTNKKSRPNRQQWNKTYWNNGTLKIFK